MGKIVVLASNEDAEAVKTALDGASVDYEIVEPTPSNILHIVIGMVDDGEEPKDEEEPTDEEPVDDAEPKAAKPKAARTDDTPPQELPDEEPPVEESLGVFKVDGELLETFRGTGDTSVLYVHVEELGQRTTYKLNESTYSFWPNDLTAPTTRVLIEANTGGASVEVLVREGKARLVIGKDLAAIFKIK